MKSEIEQLKAELAKLNENFETVKKENTVDCGGKELTRKYSYRKQTIITGLKAIR